MWLTIALTAAVCVLPVVAFRFLKLQLRPGLSDTVSWGARGGAEPAGRGLGTGAPWAPAWDLVSARWRRGARPAR